MVRAVEKLCHEVTMKFKTACRSVPNVTPASAGESRKPKRAQRNAGFSR